MKVDSKVMFATMKPWKLFFVVALPGVVSMFAMSVYSLIEGVFLGQKLGEVALTAVNIAFPMILINFSLSDLVAVGSSVPISIALGRKDEKTANNIFSCSIIMIFAVSVLMGAVMMFASEPLAALMGAEDNILDMAARYIRTYAICSPISTVFFAMDNYLRISGYVRASMLINIFCNVMTLVLLFLFIFVLDMDVVGSALASCLSMCACSVLAMIPFLRGKAILKFTRPVFHFRMIRQIVACGSPAFLNNIAGRVTSIMMNISLVTLGTKALGAGGGTTAVAAYAVLLYAGDMGFSLIYGMSDSLAPAIGFNWGAENYGRVRKIAICNYIGTFTLSIIFAGTMFFFSRPLASMFVESGNTVLLDLSSGAMKIFSIGMFFRGFSTTAQSFLSAIEKPFYATLLSVSFALVFPLIALLLLWPLGLTGIWFNSPCTTLLSTVFGLVLIRIVQSEIKKRTKRKNETVNN
ncbi:MAG: MATE family efflux transporter [Clostridia bacterium]|nr:MATE family efflux transporter [Clostridia bacterium]